MKKIYIILNFIFLSITINASTYLPIGIGGGGAMSGVAISPYDNLWFVGTDMGTIFRSNDLGKSWNAINHLEATFGSDLKRAVSPGFSSDGKTIFHAVHGIEIKKSSDRGVTFKNMNINLLKYEHIKYWRGSSHNPDVIFAGTNKGLLVSYTKGESWERIKALGNEAIGTFIDEQTVYHATKFTIWLSKDEGRTWKDHFRPRNTYIRVFSGGKDSKGTTLSFGDSNGRNACSWARQHRREWGNTKISQTTSSCGYVWVSRNNESFERTNQIVGDHLKMAENDSSTIYVTGGKNWIRQYGTKVFISRDGGLSWNLKLHQLNWDVIPFEPWPQERLEYSAVAIDVGWWDDGYESFEVNLRNSGVVAGTGYFFLHASNNYGEKWHAPFTKFADTGTEITQGKNWITRGIEVISIYKSKFHPRNPNLLYAAAADIGGLVSEDSGRSFRVSKAGYNSNYDYSFDPASDDIVYAASGNLHDYPNEWRAHATTSNGGIYKSYDRGRTWNRLTPESKDFNRQFLSVAYDPVTKRIYGGAQETGIILSEDEGKTWRYFNEGLPNGSKIIPQIEIEPKTGNVYLLLTGNAPQFTNQPYTGIYFLDHKNGSKKWSLLRRTVHSPADSPSGKKLWYYPTRFAVNHQTKELWLVDFENNNNWLMTGIWNSKDNGQNWQRLKQMTHPTDIIIDQKNGNNIHVSGYYDLSGNWGNGGQVYSTDGGKTWNKNLLPPMQHNARSVTKDPANPKRIIYSYFGGGMLSGPDPSY
jgi:photosystem II stability/assembly factor-like uncharacterized protein